MINNPRTYQSVAEHLESMPFCYNLSGRFNAVYGLHHLNIPLVIVERDGRTESNMAFATNIPIRNARALTGTMLEHYGQRWDIETRFRVIKERMGRTCSNSMVIRLLTFYLPVLMYNL